MTPKDRIFANAVEGLTLLQLDDGYKITDITSEGTHACRIRVLRGADPLVEGPRYFWIKVTEER